MSDELTLADVLEFGIERVEIETEQFDGDMPAHSARLLVNNATDLLATLTNAEVQAASEAVEADPETTIEQIEEDLIHILVAVAAVQYEHDTDIVTAFEDHMEFVDAYDDMQEAVGNAETQDEMVAAFDEHMGDYAEQNPLVDTTTSPGDNVDDDDYDPDRRDRHIA